jgi:hypothetical protein
MANNERDGSYLEVPAYEYLFLSGVAIHKRFFLAWTFTAFIGTLALLYTVLYTSMWQNLGAASVKFFLIDNWAITGIASLLGLTTFYFYNKSRISNKKKTREQEERNKHLNAYLRGDKQK